MAFKIKRKEDFLYKSPQEMYQDNKLKKIMGPIDYQSAMLDAYMQRIDRKNIALELPTGSGKTLVGLLIAEYRRRKNKDKVLFLCPTNQLVNQVVEQAREKYGILAIPFCGKQKDYAAVDKAKFQMSEAVGVTTYSAFFASYTFFTNVDVVIMDDVHSCEDYIISNWTVRIDAGSTLFDELAALLKSYISDNDYYKLIVDDYNPELSLWSNVIPVPIIKEQLDNIGTIIKTGIEESSSNYYAYERIADNLDDCNIVIANKCILIRPWIAPTMTHQPFANLKQRVLMSATLGKSGELERITGLDNITRLPIVNDWDKKGLGRKFFVFPELALPKDEKAQVIDCLQRLCKKSVFLVPDNQHAEAIKKFFVEKLNGTTVFEAKDIEKTKVDFINCEDATVVLANRFDGVDFANDESRLLFIWDLPKTTNILEKFLMYKMSASKLYEERIRTRIIQAVGRCSRNPSDYSIVCVLGDTIQNDLTKEDNLSQYAPELRAEIKFGLDNSLEYMSVDEVIEQATDFICRNSNWQEADEYIVNLRNGFWNDISESSESIYIKLQEAAKEEVKFQYSIWGKAYKEAYEHANNIVEVLNAPSLGGYKAYWQYIAGCIAYNLVSDGKVEYKAKGCAYIESARKATVGVKWFSSLLNMFEYDNIHMDLVDDYWGDIIVNLENAFSSMNTGQKFERKIKDILDDLRSADGLIFERGQTELGKILGYNSYNPQASGAPDPCWAVNSDIIIVSEDKIYEEKEKVKSIPINDVREAASHKTWIKNNVSNISKNTEIVSIFITNSSEIDQEAKIYADDLYYINRSDYVSWATEAATVLREAWNTFINLGDQEWREATYKLFREKSLTPRDYLNFVKTNKLKDI